MAENKLFKVYEELPGWAKGVVVIGGMAIAYAVGSTIYNRIKRISDDADQQDKLNKVQEELNKQNQQGVKATYTDVQFNNFADAAQNAFTNCRVPVIPCSTSLGVLCQSNSYREFYPIIEQLKNDADFLQLQKTFGVRTISKQFYCGGDIRMNLPTLVKDHLNKYEIATINSTMKANGINYTF